jgi:hypothetical protein
MAISGTRFGARKPSLWQQAQAWSAKRRQMIASFQSESSAASAGFSAAWSNQISGSTELVTQSTMARLQAEAKAKQQKALSQLDLFA